MPFLRRILHGWRNLFHKRAVDADLDTEVHAYLDLLTEEKIRAGHPPEEARRLAYLELGGAEQVKQQTREARSGFLLETIFSDLRFGLRLFARNPGFTAVAIITLALGIGATTALFSVVYAVLLRPLPYPHANQLAWIAEINDEDYASRVSYPNFEDWRADNHSFSAMAAYSGGETSVSGGSLPQRVQATIVSRGFFGLFGVQPTLGRLFLSEEHTAKAAPTALIADALWRSSFGANRGIIGRTIRMDGLPITVVGILPPSFTFPEHTQLWVTVEAFHAEMETRTAHNYRVIGRLKPHVGFDEARSDISSIARRLKKQYPSVYQAKDAQIMSLIGLSGRPSKASTAHLTGSRWPGAADRVRQHR